MKTTRRTVVTMETHELKIIRFRKSVARTRFCAGCRTAAPHLSLVEAASLLSVSEKDVCRLAQDEKIHAARNGDGQFVLCGYSLAALGKELGQ